jgi:serine phosphatase RsbU (regulator of sigma subunit)
MEERQLEQLEARELEAKRLLGREFDWPIEQQGEPIGRLRAQISAKRVLQNVLSQTRRDEGEIPFAIDAEGNVHVAREEDRDRLADLPLTSQQGEATGAPRNDLDDWVIVRLEDPESGLVYGIARPIGQSLAELRRTAVRNLAYGLGLVGLALVGVVPLSRRITRDVNALSAGAVQLAAGDLEVRVPVRSRDEVGHLARTFNQMAGQLREHQERLLEQERLRKEHEIQHRLLEAENARKSEELEAARLFQLSLLPQELPEHPELDIAVFMQTATEVGGDYYDFILGRDGALTVAVGDATGHGARAGTMVTVIKSLFTSAAADCELATFLANSSRAIKSMDLGRMAMALTLARYANRSLRVAAAGMPPLLIHRSATGEIEEVGVQGLPLGAMSDYRYRERQVGLAPGDTVLLLSDGFPELADESGEPLGYAKVRSVYRQAAARSPGELIAELARAAESWGGSVPSDDITFVALRVKI